MKKLLSVIIISFAFVAPCALAENPAKVEKPELKIGDRWTYQKIDMWKNSKEYVYSSEVTAVSDNEIREQWKMLESTSAASVGATGVDTYDGQHNISIRDPDKDAGFKRVFNPPISLYSFPLEIGKGWESRSKFTNRRNDGEISEAFKVSVVSWEKISVPAGTFEALKLQATGYYTVTILGRGTFSGSTKRTWWFSPEVKRAVKYEYEDSLAGRLYNREKLELVEYKLN